MSRKKIKFFFYHQIFQELDSTGQDLEGIHTQQSLGNKLGGLLVFVGMIFLISGLGLLLVFINNLLNLKTEVLNTTQSGITELINGAESFKDNAPDQAIEYFKISEKKFGESIKLLESQNWFTRNAIRLWPKSKQAELLLQAGISASQLGVVTAHFQQKFQGYSFTLVGQTGSAPPEKFLDESRQQLVLAETYLTRIQYLLNQIQLHSFSSFEQSQIIQFQDRVKKLKSFTGLSQDLVQMFQGFFTGQKEVLFVFQNYREIRATGGFLGTYGAVKLNQGHINHVQVSSIYDLDGQISKKIIPPEPIFALNSRWFLRDSNWFADFPTSARKMSIFYERAGKETPDFIIALTPEVVTRLLAITGPIELPGYATILTAENFIEVTQFLTSYNYDKTINTPKAMIADFLPLFLQKLMNLEANQKVLMLNTLNQILLEKHLMLYSRHSDTQAIFSKYSWAGELKPTDHDYLMINLSNLGGTKIDQTINQEVTLTSSLDKTGKIINRLIITRTNPNTPDLKNNSLVYVRFYVPKGAKLLNATGFSKSPMEGMDLQKSGIPDPDIEAIENQMLIDFKSRTHQSEESNKTIFGNWMEVKGGETSTASLEYSLPFSLPRLGSYSFLFQNQPGQKPHKFEYNFVIDSVWQIIDAGTPIELITNQEIRYMDADIKTDLRLGMVLKR